MNGSFDVIHSIDKELVSLGYKSNPTAVELTRLCLEYKKTPDEIVRIFKKINKQLID